MESDVTQTLGDLERKLKELERELESVGRGGEADVEPDQHWEAPPAAPPAGVTPFTASWHGNGPPSEVAAAPPPPPPPAYNGAAAAVPITPPTTATWHQTAPPPVEAPPAPAPAAGLSAQLDDLLAFRERLVASTTDLVDELSRVLADLGASVAAAAAAPAAPPPGPDDVVFSGAVTVQAGHFADLATLAAFEQALARTPGVADVDVRALDAGQATLDVVFAQPVALGRALRQSAPVPFTLTIASERLVHLAIAPSAPSG